MMPQNLPIGSMYGISIYVNIPYMDPMGCKYRGHEMTPTHTMHYEGEMPQIHHSFASSCLFPNKMGTLLIPGSLL